MFELWLTYLNGLLDKFWNIKVMVSRSLLCSQFISPLFFSLLLLLLLLLTTSVGPHWLIPWSECVCLCVKYARSNRHNVAMSIRLCTNHDPKSLFIISHFHRRSGEKQEFVEYKLRSARPCAHILLCIGMVCVFNDTSKLWRRRRRKKNSRRRNISNNADGNIIVTRIDYAVDLKNNHLMSLCLPHGNSFRICLSVRCYKTPWTSFDASSNLHENFD